MDQLHLLETRRTGGNAQAFGEAFHAGESLFRSHFGATDGVGCNVGNGAQFTRVPRADLAGPGQWATHIPFRTTGPNADTCTTCHDQASFDSPRAPGEKVTSSYQGNGPENRSVNVIRDPTRTGHLSAFVERNSPHLFGAGGVQRLAEEMTAYLLGIRSAVGQLACRRMATVGARLVAKTINFGSIAARPNRSSPCRPIFDTSEVAGVDPDLVVKPFQRKGVGRSIRDFVREASNDELGMQPVEVVGLGVDGDSDGVVDELTVGDVTAMALYVAAQPRPVTLIELDALGLLSPTLSPEQRRALRKGAQLFGSARCAVCHVPALTLDDATFAEPSLDPHYRDAALPAGYDAASMGLDPDLSIRFDLTRDIAGNVVTLPDQGTVALGTLRPTASGGAVVALFGDLKRHDMGTALAEDIDETGTGPSVWLTANLWGLGSTGPYMHDGRDSTIAEAILDHGGEAAGARRQFVAMGPRDRSDLVAFLNGLVLMRPRSRTAP